MNLPTLGMLRFAPGILLVAIALGLVACGPATPTRPPESPIVATPAQPTPIITQPTAVVSVAPTVSPPTATKFAIAVESPTATRAPNPTASPTTPKPAVLTGRIAYGVVTGEAPKFHTGWIANADGSGAHQILTHAQWLALSHDGSRVAYLGRPEGGSAGLYIANSDGSTRVLAVNDAGVCCIKWSRDGTWIVYAVSLKPNQPGGDIFKVKVDGVFKTIVPLGVVGNGPAFSPDGKQVVYSGSLPGRSTLGLMIVSADGGTPRQVTTENGGNADWSPRGDKIVYQAADDAGHRQLFVVNPDGSGKKQLTAGKSNDGQPAWSRDGSAIFWRSDQNGTAWAIYVMNADGTKPRKILDNVPPEPNLWGWESLSVGP